MAGLGKGPLRVAFEDFLNNSVIGKWLSKWFVAWGEDVEDAVAAEYQDLADKLVAAAEDPTKLLPKASQDSSGSHQGGIAGALAFAGQIGSSAASAFMAPVMRMLNYTMDGRIRSQRFDPSLAIQYQLRALTDRDKFVADMKQLGWSDDRITAWRVLAQQMLDSGTIMQFVNRGFIQEAFGKQYLARQGYEAQDIENLMKLRHIIPGVSDLLSMSIRDAWNEQAVKLFGYDDNYPAGVEEYTSQQGLDPEWVHRYWRAHWNLPSPNQAYEMYHRLRPGQSEVPFTESDLDVLLRTADYPPYFRKRLEQIAYSTYTRVDIRRMYGQGIISKDEVLQAYLDLGYDQKHAQNLADFAIQYEDGNGNSTADQQKNLTESLLASMYTKSIIDEGTFRSELQKLNYSSQYIDWLVSYTNTKVKTDKVPDEFSDYLSKMKSLVLSAYDSRQISKDDATSALKGLGFTDQAVTWLLKVADYDAAQSQLADAIKAIGNSYVNHTMDRSQVIVELGKQNVSGAQQQYLLTGWDNERTYRYRQLTLSQYTSLYNQQFIDLVEYKDALEGLGYGDHEIDLLVQLNEAKAGG